MYRLRIDESCWNALEQSDGLWLGLIRRSDGMIRLIACGPTSSVEQTIFPTHQAMLDSRYINASEFRGFSLAISGGAVTWFSRQSCLNVECRGNSLSVDLMDRVLLELMLRRCVNFQDFGDGF